MFKQSLLRILPGLLLVAVGYVGGMLAVSHAQLYVGGSVGSSYQSGIGDHNPDYSYCSLATNKQRSSMETLFVGYRIGYVGAEVGAGTLFHSHFMVQCPGNSGTQDLRASQRYLRLNGYVPFGYGFDFVPFVGRALVKHSNYEVSDARPSGGQLDTHLATGLNNSTFYGFGVQKSIDKFFVRAEVQKMYGVAEDPWSQRGWHNNVQTVSLAIGRYF